MRRIAFTLLAVLGSMSAHAQLYGTVALGSSHLGEDCAGLQSCKTTNTGAKLMAGYALTDHFSLQAGLMDFGKFSASEDATSTKTSVKARALTFGAALTAPLDTTWGWSARLGLAQVKAHVDAADGKNSSSSSTTKTKPYAGLSLTCAVNKATRIELGVDTTRAQSDDDSRATLRLISLGATYAF